MIHEIKDYIKIKINLCMYLVSYQNDTKKMNM